MTSNRTTEPTPLAGDTPTAAAPSPPAPGAEAPAGLRRPGARWTKSTPPSSGRLLDLLTEAARLLESEPTLIKDSTVESALRRVAGATREARARTRGK